jgi:GTP-binding protein
MLMSGVAREGVTDVLRKLRDEIDADRLREQPAQEEEAWRP